MLTPQKRINTQESDYFDQLTIMETSAIRSPINMITRNRELESLRQSSIRTSNIQSQLNSRRSSIIEHSYLTKQSYLMPMKQLTRKYDSLDKIIVKPLEFPPFRKSCQQSKIKPQHLQIQQLIKSIGRKY